LFPPVDSLRVTKCVEENFLLLSKKTCEKYNRPGHIASGILHKNNSYVVEKTAIVVFMQQ
jgi:hypothetical protein